MISEIATNAIFTHHSRMGRPRNPELVDAWTKRPRFIELLDARLEAGATYQQIAEALELTSTRSLEHEFRYDRSRRPGRKTIELAASYFGVEVWDIDGPPAEEDFGNIMGILGKNLSPETKAAMIEMAKAAQQRGRDREAAEKPYVLDPVAGTAGLLVAEPKAKPRKK